MPIGSGAKLFPACGRSIPSNESSRCARRNKTNAYLCRRAGIDLSVFNNPYLRKSRNLAAKPGTSQHGWGVALDIEDERKSPGTLGARKWLMKNGPRFGWAQPRWALTQRKTPRGMAFRIHRFRGRNIQPATNSTRQNLSRFKIAKGEGRRPEALKDKDTRYPLSLTT